MYESTQLRISQKKRKLYFYKNNIGFADIKKESFRLSCLKFFLCKIYLILHEFKLSFFINNWLENEKIFMKEFF